MLKKRQDSHGGGAGRKDSAIHREDLEIPKSEIPIDRRHRSTEVHTCSGKEGGKDKSQ